MPKMDEGRERVLLIAASILVACVVGSIPKPQAVRGRVSAKPSHWSQAPFNGRSGILRKIDNLFPPSGRAEDRHVREIERFWRKNTVCMVSNNHSECGRLTALWLTLSMHRRLEDRIRELCAKALTAQESELDAILSALRSAVREHPSVSGDSLPRGLSALRGMGNCRTGALPKLKKGRPNPTDRSCSTKTQDNRKERGPCSTE